MSSSTKFSFILFLAFSLFFQGILGEIKCEGLPKHLCSFSIASSGKRCDLFYYETNDGMWGQDQCRATDWDGVEGLGGYVETDECLHACGVDRNSARFSPDSFYNSEFVANLCSPDCHHNCPSIVDIYSQVATGEAMTLPDICEINRKNPHKDMFELLSTLPAPYPTESEDAEALAPFSDEAFEDREDVLVSDHPPVQIKVIDQIISFLKTLPLLLFSFN